MFLEKTRLTILQLIIIVLLQLAWLGAFQPHHFCYPAYFARWISLAHIIAFAWDQLVEQSLRVRGSSAFSVSYHKSLVVSLLRLIFCFFDEFVTCYLASSNSSFPPRLPLGAVTMGHECLHTPRWAEPRRVWIEADASGADWWVKWLVAFNYRIWLWWGVFGCL
jgi:hypothetical protein